MQRPNVAGRAGRWSSQHRRTAIVGWLAFVVLAVFVGGAVGTKHIPQDNDGVGESGRAQQVLYDEFPQPANEQVLIQSAALTVRDLAFRAAIQDVTGRLSGLGTVQNVRSPLLAVNHGEVSRDGHSVLVSFQITGEASNADKRVSASLAATAAAQRAHPDMRIEQAGDASSTKALNKSFSDDFAKARTLSLPITLLILVFAFGALLAAGIPVLLAGTGVAATLGLIALVSQIAAVDQVVSETVLLIGMAVGVDYSLFYMRREREERAAGRDEQAALEAAASTSGRSVLVSGLTVMAAMAGMYLAGNKTFASMATGTIMVVAVAVLSSLTVLPALLSKLGDRVMSVRVPIVARGREVGGEPRVWSAVVDRVLRRSVASMLVSGGLVVALAIPAFGLHTSLPGLQGLPAGLPIVKTLNRIEAAFPGGPLPAYVVIQGENVTSPQVQTAINSLEQKALATGEIHQPFKVQINDRHDVAVVSMPLSGKGTDAASYRALDALRQQVIPATVGSIAGTKAQVTGMTAESKDFNDSMKSHAPLVFGFVLAVAFILLLVTFRSIVLPITAIVLNLLSVGAAYGVLVLVFQHTWAQGLLGFKSTGAITSWLPLFLFVILFGLSMDYHVFIISRIREGYDRGLRTEDAIAHGIKSTAGPVTSAAIVMVAVFAIFASLGALEFKQLGVGLAAAILIDATVVRAVLLPATMKLLGDANWYLPKRLQWLPRVAHEPARA
ncbi:MAG: MMPL family transporter [Solirubrobacteraceae bacterium]